MLDALYPIFQEVLQNPMDYRRANGEEQLVAYTNSIEQEVLDTGITQSDTVVLEGHQTHESTNGQVSSNESILKIIEYHPVATRSQFANIKNHIASIESYPTDIKCHSTNIRGHSEITKDHAAMDSTTLATNSTTLAENNTRPRERKMRHQRVEKRKYN